MSSTNRPVAVVTGGTGGVGRATVREFAHAGYDVAVSARGRAGLEGAARDIETAGGRALCIPADVADEAAVDTATDRVEVELGPIDVWSTWRSRVRGPSSGTPARESSSG